jgi:hypothetical protein
MSADGLAHPAEDAWVIAVYASEDDYEPLGGGFVLDERRVLTCAHVVDGPRIWIGFPKVDGGGSDRRVPWSGWCSRPPGRR